MKPETGVCLEQRYFLMEVLGIGGTSSVFLAMDERIQRKRAVKIIRKTEYSKDRFWETEGLLMKRFHHKNIAEIFDILEDQEFVYFVMEYVEGYTLRELLKTGRRFSCQQTIHMGLQICDVLEYIHGQKKPVVYGDLKPENLMLEKNGRVVLIDFGASRVWKKEKGVSCWGTEKYASPEQKAGNETVDIRSDLYSLGIILREMLYGDDLPEEESWSQLLMDSVIEKCTRENPKERYQKIQDVRNALENCEKKKEKNFRRHKKNLFFAGILWSLSLSLLGLSEIFSRQAAVLFREGYEQYITAGERKTDKKSRISLFTEAITLNPWKEEGYFSLLREYQEDVFTGEEYEELLEILGRENQDGLSCESCFAQSPEKYGKFAFELGITCYFEWEGYGNKKYALSWLEQAKQKGNLTGEERKVAECLTDIARYYESPYRENRELTYPEKKMMETYWEDLKKLLEIPETKALRQLVYRETVGQILQNLSNFQEGGVSKEEICEVLEQIRKEDEELEAVIREGEELLELMEITW